MKSDQGKRDELPIGLQLAFLPGPVPTPCPEVMTEEEVVKYLRLDLINIAEPTATLEYYRKRGLLRGTQIGKCVRYRRIELERFLTLITERNPR